MRLQGHWQLYLLPDSLEQKLNDMTAVEWLMNEVKHIIPNHFLGKFEQALQMEREQIIEAYAMGYIESEDMTKGAADYYELNYNNANTRIKSAG